LNKQAHLTFFSRLRILEKIDISHSIDISGLYIDLLFLYSKLIDNNFIFDIKTVTYEDLIEFEKDSQHKVIKPLNKRSVQGLLIWLKKIYAFEHDVKTDYEGKPVLFSNSDLSLIITDKNISVKFFIDGNLLRYHSYSVDGVEHLIEDSILMKHSTFSRFISNIVEYHACEKSVLTMVLY
jgi:hypothetical protein